jgi:hypothetical protein
VWRPDEAEEGGLSREWRGEPMFRSYAAQQKQHGPHQHPPPLLQGPRPPPDYTHLELDVHPLAINTSERLYKHLMAFFFPEKFLRPSPPPPPVAHPWGPNVPPPPTGSGHPWGPNVPPLPSGSAAAGSDHRQGAYGNKFLRRLKIAGNAKNPFRHKKKVNPPPPKQGAEGETRSHPPPAAGQPPLFAPLPLGDSSSGPGGSEGGEGGGGTRLASGGAEEGAEEKKRGRGGAGGVQYNFKYVRVSEMHLLLGYQGSPFSFRCAFNKKPVN